MKKRPESQSPTLITLICRSGCKSCRELLEELEPMRGVPGIRLKVVDVGLEQPPAYAQAFIVPATYIGERLWRYGKFSRQELEGRLQRPVDESSHD
ncbi:MAG: hypothetical protein JSW54_06410 [Fidelibacterota bacterium]|nr:MAG: hypothetical protein JSW54_06410 [Candidatus Neomarinimicrobiota bacterium]